MLEIFRALGFLLKRAWRVDPIIYFSTFLHTLMSTLTPLIWVLIPARLIAMAEGTIPSSFLNLVLWAAVLFIPSQFFVVYLVGDYRMRMNAVRYSFIQDMIRFNLRAPYQWSLNTKWLDQLQAATKVVQDPGRGAGGILLTGQVIFGKGIASLLLIGIMSEVSWLLGLLMLGFVGLTVSLRKQELEIYNETLEAYFKEDRKIHMVNDSVLDNLSIKDIQVYDLFGILKAYSLYFTERCVALWKDAFKGIWRRQFLTGILIFIQDILLYVWLIVMVYRGDLQVADFFRVSTSLIAFTVLFQDFANDLTHIAQYAKQFTAFLSVVALADKMEAEEAGKASLAYDPKVKGLELRFENVCFTYPGQEVPVIQDLSLHMKPGERWALVGENGAGKSTLVHLLCRFYKPDHGRILVNGIDLWELSAKDYWDLLAVVFQDSQILPFTLRENVSMELQASMDEERLKQALERSRTDGLVAGYKAGVEQHLLRDLEEEGVDLSGGERQKLYLARALYRKQSQILILDEPTAALDPLAERDLYQDFANLSAQKTSLFISHRLASTQFCDQIAFLEAGRVLEQGSHQDLMAAKGRYHELFDLQAKHYREEV